MRHETTRRGIPCRWGRPPMTSGRAKHRRKKIRWQRIVSGTDIHNLSWISVDSIPYTHLRTSFLVVCPQLPQEIFLSWHLIPQNADSQFRLWKTIQWTKPYNQCYTIILWTDIHDTILAVSCSYHVSSCLANFRLAVLNEAGNDILLFFRTCLDGSLQSTLHLVVVSGFDTPATLCCTPGWGWRWAWGW